MFVFYTIQQFPASNLYIKVIHLLHVKTCPQGNRLQTGSIFKYCVKCLLDVYDNYINWNVSLP